MMTEEDQADTVEEEQQKHRRKCMSSEEVELKQTVLPNIH